VPVCDVQSIPMTFSLSCVFTGATVPSWNVTGLSMGGFELISEGESVDGYLTYPSISGTTARLNVNLATSMQVVTGTCFQCVLNLVGEDPVSGKGCVTVVGKLSACTVCDSITISFRFTLFCFLTKGRLL